MVSQDRFMDLQKIKFQCGWAKLMEVKKPAFSKYVNTQAISGKNPRKHGGDKSPILCGVNEDMMKTREEFIQKFDEE